MSHPGDEPPPTRDPGLQPERTSISWTRTCTALIAVGLIGTKLHAGSLAILVSLAGLIASAVLMVVSGRRGRRTARDLPSGRVRPALELSLSLTVLVLALNATALAMVLTRPG